MQIQRTPAARSISGAITVLLLLGITLTACAPAVAPVVLPKPRITTPQVDQADSAALADGNRALAFDLYHALRDGDANLFFSPYSISLALAMTYAGARGQTQQQMASALHFTLPPDRLHPAFNALDLDLTRASTSGDNGAFQLSIANAIWTQQGYAYRDDFLLTLAENYGAGPRSLDFVKAAEAARQTINAWVSEQTRDKIKDLIPPGTIDALTRLVLTNAIYFKASWDSQFKEAATTPGDFHLPNGSTVQVPLMNQVTHLAYTEGENYQAVTIPYSGSQFSMIVILPQAGQFTAFEDALTADGAEAIIAALQPRQVKLTMPKFRIESSVQLNDALIKLGMVDAFSPDAADFSGVTEMERLYISAALHKAFVAVDENGTEAAAATAVIMGVTSAPLEPDPLVEFKMDRPFIFAIRDDVSGTLLFVGRVLNPQS